MEHLGKVDVSMINGGMSPKARHILDLPTETLGTIFAHVAPSDLVKLCLVSRKFRDHAVSRLYRELRHTFTDFEDRHGHPLVDRLPAILETLVTSDYNYAQYIKGIFMDNVYCGDIGDRAIQEYLYEYSCGKFLNTLLLATLKKTAALETFHWDVRIELSPPVLKTLHDIPSLQHLHVRLQPGLSMHSSVPHQSFYLPPPPAMPPPPQPPPPPHTPYIQYNNHIVLNHSGKPLKRVTAGKLPSQDHRTFSGFKGLTTLSILDMGSLEYLSEIAESIGSSCRTLRELKLSFSETLALKARKKPVQESDTETAPEDDLFDENDDMIAPPTMPNAAPAFAAGNTSSDADVRKERAAQEKALAKIFSLEKDTTKSRKLEKIAEDAINQADQEAKDWVKTSARADADKLFVKKLKSLLDGSTLSEQEYPPNSTVGAVVEKLDKALTEYFKCCDDTGVKPRKPKPSSIWSNKFPPSSHKPKHPPTSAQHFPPMPPSTSGSGYLPSQPSLSGQSSFDQDFDFDSFLIGSQPPSFPAPGQIYNYVSNSKAPKPPSFPSYAKPPGFPAKMPNKKKTYPHPVSMYKGSSAYVAAIGPASANNNSPSSKIKDKTLLNKNSPNSASLPAWNDADDMPAITTETSSAGKVPNDVYDDDIDIASPDVVDDDDMNSDQELLDTLDRSGDNHSNDNGNADDESTDATTVPHATMDGASLPIPHYDHSTSKDKGKETDPGVSAAKAEGKGKGKAADQGCSPDEKIRPNDTGSEYVTSEQAIQEYVRLNHGLPLEKLSIYLIPVKASVLFRAVDFSGLKSLTLLNVGPQRAIWAALTKVQKCYPLNLKSIYTDNVTPSFLVFLNGLESKLEDLFLLERGSRTKVEPFAPKTPVGIEDIRAQVLTKHMKTLKRLMLRNDDDTTWALSKKCVRLLAKHGQQLRELVVSLAHEPFHYLMQNIACLISLRALQIISVNVDSSQTVIREIRQCVVDNISHYPQLQVKYVAISSGVSLFGPLGGPMFELVKKYKGPLTGDLSSDQERVEDDNDDDDSLPFSVIDGLKTRDAVNVRVWEKEFAAGQL